MILLKKIYIESYMNYCRKTYGLYMRKYIQKEANTLRITIFKQNRLDLSVYKILIFQYR